MNCEICIHFKICKYAGTKIIVPKEVLQAVPEIWSPKVEFECREFVAKHEQIRKYRKPIPKKVIEYVNKVGIENFDKKKAVEYFKSIGHTKTSADTYAVYCLKYIREIRAEKEQTEIDKTLEKFKNEELQLKREY
jgi:hypothetical protein